MCESSECFGSKEWIWTWSWDLKVRSEMTQSLFMPELSVPIQRIGFSETLQLFPEIHLRTCLGCSVSLISIDQSP